MIWSASLSRSRPLIGYSSRGLSKHDPAKGLIFCVGTSMIQNWPSSMTVCLSRRQDITQHTSVWPSCFGLKMKSKRDSMNSSRKRLRFWPKAIPSPGCIVRGKRPIRFPIHRTSKRPIDPALLRREYHVLSLPA